MATIKDWEKEADKLSVPRLNEIKNAIKVLQAWDFFADEFAGTGVWTVGAICKHTAINKNN